MILVLIICALSVPLAETSGDLDYDKVRQIFQEEFEEAKVNFQEKTEMLEKKVSELEETIEQSRKRK